MAKENVGLLHGLLFAVLVIVMVYAGDQVKTHDTGAASWLMRCAAIVSSIGIASLGLSFVPALRSNAHSDTKDRSEQIAERLYSYRGSELEYLHKETVRKIEYESRKAAYFAALQDVNDAWNKRLTHFSQAAGCNSQSAMPPFADIAHLAQLECSVRCNCPNRH